MCIFGNRSVPAPPPLPPAPTAPPPDPVVQEVNPQVADAMDERSEKEKNEQSAGTSALHIPLSPQVNTGQSGGAGSGGLN